MCSLKDAKLGKKCTLLDLSRRASVAEPEAQGAAVLSCATQRQESSSTPKPPTDHLTSVEDLESNERLEEELKSEADKKEKTEELSANESPAKMEVDPTDSRSDEEQSMTACNLVSDSLVFNFMWSMSCAHLF